jgi:hypothetical protein
LRVCQDRLLDGPDDLEQLRPRIPDADDSATILAAHTAYVDEADRDVRNLTVLGTLDLRYEHFGIAPGGTLPNDGVGSTSWDAAVAQSAGATYYQVLGVNSAGEPSDGGGRVGMFSFGIRD